MSLSSYQLVRPGGLELWGDGISLGGYGIFGGNVEEGTFGAVVITVRDQDGV